MNQDTNNDGICDLNCDTDVDGYPELNVDTDGDGVMTAMDYVNIKNHIMELRALTGVYLRAADVDNDNNVSPKPQAEKKTFLIGEIGEKIEIRAILYSWTTSKSSPSSACPAVANQ